MTYRSDGSRMTTAMERPSPWQLRTDDRPTEAATGAATETATTTVTRPQTGARARAAATESATTAATRPLAGARARATQGAQVRAPSMLPTVSSDPAASSA